MSTKQTNKKTKFRFEPKITETGSVSRLFRFIFETNENFVSVCFGMFWCFECILKKLKQTDFFQNEPKQTKNDLNNSNSTQKNALFSAAVFKTNRNKQICFKMNQNKPKMNLKIAIVPKKCSLPSCSFQNKSNQRFFIE